MEALSIEGAWLFTPSVHGDDRGVFLEAFRGAEFAADLGYRLDVAQVNTSVSRRGVIRGIHYADVPPGQAKYVTCVAGAILDVVVDLRAGSPTFGSWETVRLDDEGRKALFLAEGLGHGFQALSDSATVLYLCSTPYAAGREHGVNPMDPEIGIGWRPDRRQASRSCRTRTSRRRRSTRRSGPGSFRSTRTASRTATNCAASPVLSCGLRRVRRQAPRLARNPVRGLRRVPRQAARLARLAGAAALGLNAERTAGNHGPFGETVLIFRLSALCPLLRGEHGREGALERVPPVADRLDSRRQPPVVAEHAVGGPWRRALVGGAGGRRHQRRVGAREGVHRRARPNQVVSPELVAW